MPTFLRRRKQHRWDDPEFLKNLFEATGKPQAFHFYGLTAQFKDNGYAIETMRSGYAITPATGARADELIAQHHKLFAAKEQGAAPIVRTLEKKYNQIDETLAGEPGQETFCAHLAEMLKRKGIAALDNKPTVWQINWILLVVELGNMLTDRGDRLWLTVALEDLTGRTTATMNEKTALSLSGITDN